MPDLIQPAAVAAWSAVIAGATEQALDAVMVVLTGSGIAREALTTADVNVELQRAIFTDGGTYLAAVLTDVWGVYLVTFADGQWTRHGTVLANLAELGKALS
jgi:hypothetical protein